MSFVEIAVKALTEAETEALAEALAGAVMGYSFERLIEGLVEVLFEALEGMDGRVWSVEEAEPPTFRTEMSCTSLPLVECCRKHSMSAGERRSLCANERKLIGRRH